MSFLQLIDVDKKYTAKGPMVVKKASLEIDEGEFVVFLGPSGCGKTTIIRMIAGLEELTGGDIRMNGQSIIDKLPKDREVSMIFQSYAVWPHMTVYDNIAYPLKLRKIKKEEIDSIVREVAENCELTPYLKRYPSQMSGGQRQRVAVARAIAVKPKLFLMDEPLSNLDAKLRISMRTELKKIHNEIGATSIFVTHDQSEAMSLADKIVIINNGIIEQIGTPNDVYHKSETVFVASFIGSPATNFFNGRIVEKEGIIYADAGLMKIQLGKQNAAMLENYRDKSVVMGIRPENFKVYRRASKNTLFKTEIAFSEPQGSFIVLILNVGGQQIKVVTNDFMDLKAKDEIFIGVDDKDISFFNEETQRRIKA